MGNDLSAADLMAIKGDGNEAWTNNPFIYFVWMMFMRWFNNGENGGNALTQAELFDGLGRQDILGNQRSILDAICGVNSSMQAGFGNLGNTMSTGFGNVNAAMANGFGNVRYDNLQNTYTLNNAMTSGFYGVNSGLAENRFAQQECCCTTNRNIDNLKAENYRNTCEITTAIHAEGEATRALINANTMQDLRDKLADRDRQLMTSELFSAQQAQTQNLIGTLRPVPVPAYITCSPYASSYNGYCASCGA